ncbi:MAG: hypothetical protein U9Q81_21535, partial [Pseudomonadota bacterium]|nr:hypothetical protein [Pseudomonadota bacterium]
MIGQGQLGINLSGLVVAVLLILAAVMNRPPLESERPRSAKIEPAPLGRYEVVPARLWEDPFEAIARIRPASNQENSGSDQSDVRPPANPVRDYLNDLAKHDAEIVLMPILVSGGPYPTLRETRLRRRLAVLAGLGTSNRLPVRSDRLGHWQWEFGKDGRGKLDIPFEAFRRGGGKKPVLVLWLDDDVFGAEGPLCLLNRMLSEIAGDEVAEFPAAVRVLGPASSDSLKEVYRELEGRRTCKGGFSYLGDSDARYQDFQLISPVATTPSQNLVGHDVAEGMVEIEGSGETFVFHRTITTDDEIVAYLLGELRLRGIDPTASWGDNSLISSLFSAFNKWSPLYRPDPEVAPRDHVALISEWDTKFGRTLPHLFRQQATWSWCQGREEDKDEEKECYGRVKQAAPWIHQFAYIRGLDGDTPADANKVKLQRDAGKTDVVALATGGEGGFKEPAVGGSQFDYLRRMTREIEALDWQLRRDDRGSIKAFGILGSDFYDKLLILQALKERFPSQLYFTTDLDARYLDAKVFRWTRNLVIGSSFGLTLSREHQRKVLPFRDSYQTAVFLATRQVFEEGEPGASYQKPKPKPRIFEVGYRRFFDLKTPEAPCNDIGDATPVGTDKKEPCYRTPGVKPADNDKVGPTADSLKSTGPDSWEFARNHAPTLVLAGLLALFLAVWVLPQARHWLRGLLPWSSKQTECSSREPSAPGSAPDGDHRSDTSAPAWRLSPWLYLGASLFYLSLLAWLIAVASSGEEPFAWSGGVSIWPSELARLLAGFLACLFLISGWRLLERTDQNLLQDFKLPVSQDGDLSGRYRKSFSQWYADARDARANVPLVRRIRRLVAHDLPLIAEQRTPESPPIGDGVAAAQVWRYYRQFAGMRPRALRVLTASAAFWLLGVLILYGLGDPLSPHRGAGAYWFSTFNGLIALGVPFVILLFAALDEALLCGTLLRHMGAGEVSWPAKLGLGDFRLEPEMRAAVDYWLTIEFAARRTEPSGNLVYVPFIVILFILFSFSTRFDNWDTPGSVLGLIGLSVTITLVSSIWLRNTAQRVRQKILNCLSEEISGIEYAAAKTHSEQL